MQHSDTGTGREFKNLEFFGMIVFGKHWMMAQGIRNIVMVIAGWLVTGLELLIRIPGTCGTQYMNVWRLAISYIVMFGAFLFFSFINGMSGAFGAVPIWPLFLLIYPAMAFWHWTTMTERLDDAGLERERMSIHIGIPWLLMLYHADWREIKARRPYLRWLPDRPVTCSPQRWVRRVQNWLEPGSVLLASMLVHPLDPVIGWWLWWTGLIVFVHNRALNTEEKARHQGILDARTQSGYIQEELHSPPSTVGQRTPDAHVAEDVAAPVDWKG